METQPQRRIIRGPVVCERTGKTMRGIRRGVRNGTFPAPVQLGLRAVGWFEDEVDAWIAALPRRTYRAPAPKPGRLRGKGRLTLVSSGPRRVDPVAPGRRPSRSGEAVSMNAAFRPIPVFEPEVIAAGAARHRGDDGKIATTSLGEVAWRGVRISSRYAKAREMENVLQMLRAVPENLLEPVLSVWCDSKSSDYRVEVKPCTPFQARMLAGALAAASEGHNTITLHTLGEVLVELGPNEGGCR